eukprot:CAMPEP_0202486138 /NCGR_PEP_ID=MMETSP1361-20130828/4786_1 /ASSEMBLY_ACC=CAM_ASM_000849 /TAXON_ID=210615 /ORGANISM="Staurosira complex sp., Strain CCMP2646" /LENGTH=208 /DNA_ID=CAMNT_0049115195 /DNA_START=55 /DNA_END=677 /DNA_ORIENTATION=-
MAHQFDISNFSASDADSLGKMAKIAESAERYEDMCAFARKLVEAKGSEDLSIDERNMLSVAYKNVIGARRASWRTLSTCDEKDTADVQAYLKVLESELGDISNEVLGLLNNTLIPNTKGKDNDSEVFFLKMAGDYHRYMAEFAPNDGNDKKAAENYEAAMKVAQSKLSPTHPIRLGLALNYSVCQYEILKDHEAACALAKKAFDDAIS